MSKYTFPFGSVLKPVIQKDRTQKKAFVLGVYASAVHARWYSPDNKIIVRALAVASEPEIFWRGEGVDKIIAKISVPVECGYLKPADKRFNGPSGHVLDEQFLKPLGYSREDVWLCDILPECRLNKGQVTALKKFTPFVEKGLVPAVTIPEVPKEFSSPQRIEEIISELMESKAELLITLGDIPLREFVSQFNSKWNRLSALVPSKKEYGKRHILTISGKTIELLPLVHPRQAGRLGAFSVDWASWHDHWSKRNLD